MVVLKFFIFIIISVVLSGLAIWYREYYVSEKKCSVITSIKKNKHISILICIAYILFAVLTLIFYPKKELSIITAIQFLLLWDVVFVIALIDFQLKKIPTELIIFLFIVRIIGFAVDGIVNEKNIVQMTLSPLIGLITAAVTVMIVMFVSKGIGMGDLRLFAIVGFYFGILGLIPIMIYTIFPSAVVAAFMMLFKKAEKKSTIPMAPFIFIGVTTYYIFL